VASFFGAAHPREDNLNTFNETRFVERTKYR
jgi:hypothetical protein